MSFPNFDQRTFSILAIVSMILFDAGSAAAQSQYTIIDLDGASGRNSSATAISSNGLITGYTSSPPDLFHPFRYDHGTFTDLGNAGGTDARGASINSKGEIVGTFFNGSGFQALYAPGNTAVNLGLSGSVFATGINDSSQIVGWQEADGQTAQGYIYQNGSIKYLPTFGGVNTYAYGINNAGQVTGGSDTQGVGGSHAFIYANGVMKDLGTLGGGVSYGLHISQNGRYVAGDSLISSTDYNYHAFLYADGVMKNIGLSGQSYASSVNDSGQAVGAYSTAQGFMLGAFFFDGKKSVNLNTLLPKGSGWNIDAANDIDNQGDIVGEGLYNGGYHAFLMIPIQSVPEPDGFATLIGFGVAGSVLTLRRRRQNSATNAAVRLCASSENASSGACPRIEETIQ